MLNAANRQAGRQASEQETAETNRKKRQVASTAWRIKYLMGIKSRKCKSKGCARTQTLCLSLARARARGEESGESDKERHCCWVGCDRKYKVWIVRYTDYRFMRFACDCPFSQLHKSQYRSAGMLTCSFLDEGKWSEGVETIKQAKHLLSIDMSDMFPSRDEHTQHPPLRYFGFPPCAWYAWAIIDTQMKRRLT